ncbi:hypothetical protein HMPREF9413_1345 [Paenibacillus sp. HGF7]|nr:hypothetical protein HMPREF9413_1345 [Paenibacillus sp. HGF7]
MRLVPDKAAGACDGIAPQVFCGRQSGRPASRAKLSAWPRARLRRLSIFESRLPEWSVVVRARLAYGRQTHGPLGTESGSSDSFGNGLSFLLRRGVYKTPSLLCSAPSARFGCAHGLHSGERQIVALRFVYRSIAPRFFVCRSIVLHFACRSIAVPFAYRSRFTATADFHLPFPFYPPNAGLYCMPSWSFRLMAIHRLPDKRY